MLALTVGANFWLYVAANDDRGIAIEPDYYQKAVAWDSSMAQARENRRSGWRVTPSLARLHRARRRRSARHAHRLHRRGRSRTRP